ncbi:hypothetical protein DFH06DRAFT_1147015 [Mycena polygramma]|nr:hypothetical protein DFH06DRAFT_1147015 [Mycena polygramma]
MPARPGGMKLRPDRALNPGKPDMKKSIRTALEVQEEKDAKAAEKQETAEKRREGLANAAAIENKIVEDDRVRAQTANNPPLADLKKALRPRTEKPAAAEEDDTSKIIYSLQLTSQLTVAVDAQGVVDPCSNGPGSSDDYQPAPDDKPASESDDEVMDVSEDEEKKPTKAGRAKKAPKGSVRREVDAERVKQGGSVAEGKRKAPPAEQVFSPLRFVQVLICRRSKANKKHKKAPLGGLRVDWDRGRTPLVDSLAPSRSRSTSSGVIHRRSASSDADMPPGSDSSAIGGIPSDADDGDEGAYAESERVDAKSARAKENVPQLAELAELVHLALLAPARQLMPESPPESYFVDGR